MRPYFNKEFVSPHYFRMLEHNPDDVQSAMNQGYYEKFFVELGTLGRGARGSVFLCRHKLGSLSLGEYAVKKIAVGLNKPWLARMLREVKLLERLRHPNIISYKHAWLENHQLANFGPPVCCLFILMECAANGSLEELLNPRDLRSPRERLRNPIPPPKLNPDQIVAMIFDIASGLLHLHNQGIIHRDLKPSNILVGKDQEMILTDFGDAELPTDVYSRTGYTGTLEFIAPELLTKTKNEYTSRFSTSTDVWSLGIICYLLCYSSSPYKSTEFQDLRVEIKSFNSLKFPYRKDVEFLKPLIKTCLSLEPLERPKCDEIIAFLNSFNKTENNWKQPLSICLKLIILYPSPSIFMVLIAILSVLIFDLKPRHSYYYLQVFCYIALQIIFILIK